MPPEREDTKPACHVPGCDAWERGKTIYRISPKGEPFVGACRKHMLRPPKPGVAEIFERRTR